jgi:RNA polymerase sigma-70 factor (ECF subfamily)
MTTQTSSSRDHDRFKSLYERYYRRIVAYYMRGFRLSQADAENLTQDTFLRFFEMLDEYRGEAEWALLERIARTVGLNSIRSLHTARRGAGVRTLELDEALAAGREPAAPPEPDYAEREETAGRRKRLHDEIERLPKGQRHCLQLWLSEVSYEGIARNLGITLDAVRSRLRDARKVLRERLGDAGALPEDEP